MLLGWGDEGEVTSVLSVAFIQTRWLVSAWRLVHHRRLVALDPFIVVKLIRHDARNRQSLPPNHPYFPAILTSQPSTWVRGACSYLVHLEVWRTTRSSTLRAKCASRTALVLACRCVGSCMTSSNEWIRIPRRRLPGHPEGGWKSFYWTAVST